MFGLKKMVNDTKILICASQALFRLFVFVCLSRAVARCSCDCWFLGTGGINS